MPLSQVRRFFIQRPLVYFTSLPAESKPNLNSLHQASFLQSGPEECAENIELRVLFNICWLGRVNLDSSHLYNASKPNRYETKVIKKVKISLYKGRARVI